MKVLEIKNNLVKISYEAVDNLALSGFVIIEDENNPYVAQIVNIKGDSDSNFAIVKLLFTFDEDGILKNYNGTAPTVNAKVSKLPSNELLEIIPVENSIFIGNLAQQSVPLKVDKSIFENNLLICSDNLYNTTGLLDNLVSQIDEKTIIIDTEGQISSGARIKLGEDFKLPLNYEAIDFIYENDLEDVDAINKAVIQDVFIEVQNYVKTLPEKFLPINTFINVIDAQYRETHIPELILLKNKLLKYKEMNLFAENLKEIVSLSIVIEKSNSLVIDISDIPDNVQKEVLRYLYEVLSNLNTKIYSFIKLNSNNTTKKLLKKYIERNGLYTTIICPHSFKYIEEIKEVSQNMIFFAPLTLSHDFASYNTYLSKLNSNEFVIYGAHTQNIPFIVEVTDLEDMAKLPDNSEVETQDNENTAQNPFDENSLTEKINDDNSISTDDVLLSGNEENNDSDKNLSELENDSVEEINDESDFENLAFNDAQNIEDENFEEKNVKESENDVFETTDLNDLNFSSEDESDEESIIVEDVANYDDSGENFVEEQESDYADNTIITENNEIEISPEESVIEADEEVADEPVIEPLVVEDSQEQMVEQAAKDVDRMFYEKIDDNEPDDDFADTSEDLTEDDLNLIEDLAADDIPLAGELEDAVTQEEEDLPPVVPIYPADDIEEADIHEFQPGDRVKTAKYGEGVVEKMIKYGNKMLCSINFPNIGRRLLDPAITEITGM